MNEQEKQLVLIDLCARLPWGVILQINKVVTEKLHTIDNQRRTDNWFVNGFNIDVYEVKPYLRPMSSMTKEEERTYLTLMAHAAPFTTVEWLDKNNFDHRTNADGDHLINLGLAIAVTEENNPYKE